jgi:hypothetical protein
MDRCRIETTISTSSIYILADSDERSSGLNQFHLLKAILYQDRDLQAF